MRVIFGLLGIVFPISWMFAIGYVSEWWVDYTIHVREPLGTALWIASFPLAFLSIAILLGGTIGLWYLALRAEEEK